MAVDRSLVEGIQLFNARKYFEAHEALEALWLNESGRRKTFLRGLIQVAAAFHHHSRNNLAGFRSLLVKGCSKLKPCGAEFAGIDLAGFLAQLQLWQEHLHSVCSHAMPPLPQIEWAEKPDRL